MRGRTNIGGISTSDANAVASDLLVTRTAYVNDVKITGTMLDKSTGSHLTDLISKTGNELHLSIPDRALYGDDADVYVVDADWLEANIKVGVDIFGKLGTFTADANAVAGDMLTTKTAYVNGVKITGNIPSLGIQTITPSTVNQTISSGQYLSGAQTILGDVDLINANIKAGANIFGVEGKPSVVDTESGDAVAGEMLAGKKAYVNGALVIGNIASKALATITPSTVNQVISAGQYLSGDQTVLGDTDLVTDNVKAGATIFGVAGKASVVDTADADAVAGNILATKTAYVNGVKITGNIPSLGIQTITPSTVDQTINSGQFLSGAQTILGDPDLISNNIKAGANIFGVAGNSNVVDTGAGTAVAGEILAGKIAFVDGVQITGTIVNRAGNNGSLATSPTGTTLYMRPPAGYYDGVDDTVYTADADFVAGNVKTGVNIFGVAGTFTSDANAVAGDMKSTKTAYVNGVKITGTIPVRNNTDTGGTYPIAVNTTYWEGMTYMQPPAGYYDGNVYVRQSIPTLTASNIKKGVAIGNVIGTLEWEYTQLETMLLRASSSSAGNAYYRNILGDSDSVYTVGGLVLRKLNPVTMAQIASTSDSASSAEALAVDDGFVYSRNGSNTSQVVTKYNKTTLATVSSSATIMSNATIIDIEVDASFVYVLTTISDPFYIRVVKLNISDLSLVATYNLSGVTQAFCFASDATYLYFGTSDGYIYKIQKSNMAFVASMYVGSTPRDLALDNGILYVACQSSLKRIALTNFGVVATSVNTTEYYTVDTDGVHLYTTSSWNTAFTLTKSNMTTLAVVSSIALTGLSNGNAKKGASVGDRYCFVDYTLVRSYAKVLYVK